jgi:hypothetical protein
MHTKDREDRANELARSEGHTSFKLLYRLDDHLVKNVKGVGTCIYSSQEVPFLVLHRQKMGGATSKEHEWNLPVGLPVSYRYP